MEAVAGVAVAGRLYSGTGLNLRWLRHHPLQFPQGAQAALQLPAPIVMEITVPQAAHLFLTSCAQAGAD